MRISLAGACGLAAVLSISGCAGRPTGGEGSSSRSGTRPPAERTSASAPEIVTNSIGMRLVCIPAGSFTMGSPADEVGREDDEQAHVVAISRAFRLSVTEVTQAQWLAIMGPHQGCFAGADLPVEEISWSDAVAFCRKLSERERRTYRLPTEAEWEYACRSGASGRFAGEPLDAIAWYDGNSDRRTHAVATKRPNPWRLHDMHGNVAEWCADYYAPHYAAEPATDPTGPSTGKARVIRGGSWGSSARGCRCASRSSAPENYQLKFVGFRVVQDLPADDRPRPTIARRLPWTSSPWLAQSGPHFR